MVQSRQRQQNIEVQVGDRFPLTIRRLGVNGQGIGYFKHKVCFVPGALPHEVVVADVGVVAPASELDVHQVALELAPLDDAAELAAHNTMRDRLLKM